MKEMVMEEKTRHCEIEMELDATVDQVWKALTDAQELSRWFPPRATVEPGEGGNIHLSWAPYVESDNRIQVWDPPRHLRTGWFNGPGGVEVIDKNPDEARRLAVDYFIESKGGRTILRLVHSGFSTASHWDEEYDGVRRGWTCELRSLRQYLGHHLGRDRSLVWLRRSVDAPDSEVWNRLMSREGLMTEGNVKGLKEGDPYALRTADGSLYEGIVQVNIPPLDFSGTVDRLGGGLLRLGIEACTGERQVHLWLSAWGVPETEIKIEERKLNDLMERLFPESP